MLCSAPIQEVEGIKWYFYGWCGKITSAQPLYQAIAEKQDALFLDIGQVIQVSQLDGIHYDADQLPGLAKAVWPLIESVL
ncbi:hypothetical protein PT286_01010 [Neisseriaceae bacterium ESL0693]|nr:hypothetical protein [Neisseriaceae bacterium ESL0693]